jgi:hypothetical protein
MPRLEFVDTPTLLRGQKLERLALQIDQLLGEVFADVLRAVVRSRRAPLHRPREALIEAIFGGELGEGLEHLRVESGLLLEGFEVQLSRLLGEWNQLASLEAGKAQPIDQLPGLLRLAFVAAAKTQQERVVRVLGSQTGRQQQSHNCHNDG